LILGVEIVAVSSGFIYVLTHPSDPNLVKVGITARDPATRLEEHNSQFEKAVGSIVMKTGEKWVLKTYFKVEDMFNAESAFFQRSPLADIPFRNGTEMFLLDGKFLTWEWVEEGIRIALEAGIRRDSSRPPSQTKEPKRGSKWIASQLEGSGITAIDGYGNGIMRKTFECAEGHRFKIDGGTLARLPFCPVCMPERFDLYTLKRVELPTDK
jgi:hypothetical protein